MIILTIFSLILLYKMHDKDSKASYTIKTFGFLDLICSWGLIFFGYIIILLYTLPNGKENFVNIITLKNGIAEFSIIAVFIILGILSIIHIIKHIIYLKKMNISIISTLVKHLLIALTFMITIPIYYFFKDPHGKFDKWSEEIEEKRARQYEQNISNQTKNSYTEDRVEYGYIRDDNGNLTTYSKSKLRDANGRVYSENVHYRDDKGNDHDIFISK